MTELLRKAFREASKLSPEGQDAIASILLAELESDRRWQDSFEKSRALLEEMADQAIAQDEAGLTEPLNSGAAMARQARAQRAVSRVRRQAAEQGVDRLSPEEIEEEVRGTRSERSGT